MYSPRQLFGSTLLYLALGVWVSYGSTTPGFAHELIADEDMEAIAESPDFERRRALMADIQDRTLDRLRNTERFLRIRAEGEAAGLSGQEIGQRLFSGPNPAFPTGTGPLTASGDSRILVVLIDFPDMEADNEHPGMEADTFETGIFGAGGDSAAAFFPFDSAHNFYDRASGGKLNLNGQVHGWVRMQKERADYKPVGISNTAHQLALLEMFKEAMNAIDDDVDFGDFDNDNDGDIDGLVVLYSGPREGWGDFFWAYRWQFFVNQANQPDAIFDGKKIDQFVFQFIDQRGNGDFEMKTLVHEAGHLLGLNDYYDYCSSTSFFLGQCAAGLTEPGPDGGVGNFDMMDANWGNHNAYSRWLLDWIRPKVVGTGTHTVTLRASSAEPENPQPADLFDAVAVFPALSEDSDARAPSKEMFIVEYRAKTGNDAQLPGDGGVLIWHLAARSDDAPLNTQFDNSFTTPKQLRLVRAGNPNDFDVRERARAEDFFTTGKIFGPTTLPNSNSNFGEPTGITISDIVIQDDTATLSIKVEPTAPVQIGGTFMNSTMLAAANTEPQPDGGNDFDLDQLVALEKELSMLPAEELARRWTALQPQLAAEPSLTDFTEARMLLVKWASKDGASAIGTLAASSEDTQRLMAGVVDDALIAFVEAAPHRAGDAYFDSASPSFREIADRNGSLEFVSEVFAARASEDMETITSSLEKLQNPQLLYSAVRGLTKGGATAEDLKSYSEALTTNQVQYENILQFDSQIQQFGQDFGGSAFSDAVLQSLEFQMERQQFQINR